MSALMLDDQQLTDVLRNWAQWQRSPDLRIGWPRRAHPFQPTGEAQTVGDVPQSDYYAECDAHEAKIVQTVVDDLPGILRDAIYNTVMGTRRPLGEPLEVVYIRARAMLRVRLAARGIG